jgi:hypothetical protein
MTRVNPATVFPFLQERGATVAQARLPVRKIGEISRLKAASLAWPLDEGLTEAWLYPREALASTRLILDFAMLNAELARRGVTRLLLCGRSSRQHTLMAGSTARSAKSSGGGA